MEEAEMGFVGKTLDGSVQCGDSVKGGEDVKYVGTETSLFAELLETIDSILSMPPIGNDNIDGNSNIVDDIEEMSNFGNDKFDSNSNIFADIMETINSILNLPIGNDKVDCNSNIVHEVVCGTEVEKCNAKEQIIADKDVSGVSALDAGQSDVHEGKLQIDVEDQQGTERSKTTNQTAEVKGLSVSIGSEEIFDANTIVEKGTQITDQGSHVLLRDGKEKINEQSNMRQNVEEQECVSEQVGLGSNGGQEIEEEFIEGKRKPTDGKAIEHQAQFSLPTIKKEGQFSVSDMVWSKVRSHPWWPAQIFDHSDASEWAMKHYKKDCYFVAYFGDKTFAWNEASQLKHFRTHFSTMEKQRTSSESFQNAIDCALDEVSRRVEYGLACSCIPKDTYDTIKSQTVDNTGIRQEISITHEVDESRNADSFSPMKLIEYVKTLSDLPTGGFDRLELEIAKAQLVAFNRFKSFSCLPEIQRGAGADKDNPIFVDDEQDLCEVIEHGTPVVNKDDQAGTRNLKNQSSTHQKRKYNFKDILHPTKKEKKMSNPMNGTLDSPDSDCWTPDNLVSPKPAQVNRWPYSREKESESNHAETPEKPPGVIDENAPAELFMNFAEFNSVPSETNLNRMFRRFGPLKESETEVDRVSGRAKVVFKKGVDAEVALSSAKKFNIFGSVLLKNSESNHAETPEKPLGYIDENAPAELVMNFSEFKTVPSETNLNKMFRRFGQLKESETEVDRVSSRARVVFKKCVDAEIALSSAKKFNIFGSALVNYQLNYTPSAQFKAVRKKT